MDDFSLIESDKYLTVMKWLKQVFGDEPVPPFNKEESFILHLTELMTLHKNLEIKTQCFTEFHNVSRSDYEHDLTLLRNKLKSIGLSAEGDNVKTCVDSLASIASDLCLSEVDTNSYMLALTELLSLKEKTTSELDLLTSILDQGTQELTEYVNVTSQLESLTAKLNGRHAEEIISLQSQMKEADFLLQKVSKYKSDKRKQEAKLSKSGISSGLMHERLIADCSELKDLTAKLNNTQEQLKMFSDLPPDIQLARVRLEVAKSELQDIENELAKQIDMFHL